MQQWGNEAWMMPMMAANMGPGHNMGPLPNMGPGPNIGPGSHMGPVPPMGPGPNMGPPALLPTPVPTGGPPGPDGIPPLAPPNFLLGEWMPGSQGIGPESGFIGPKKPDEDLTVDDNDKNANKNQMHGNEHPSRNSRDNRDQRDGKRDFGDRGDRGRRPRSPYNRNRDRNDRSRSDRRERRPRWSDNKDQPDEMMGNNMMMPGRGQNMMQYGNMMGQSMDMGNMGNMGNMQNMMPNMMPGMMGNMMPGMNMMPNMMDQNMMMMQQMPMNNLPICTTSGVLLPPLPNTSSPTRRERPPGCRTIFVGGLPHTVGEEALKEIFERFGIVDEVKLHKQGVSHVRFRQQEHVEASFYLSGFRFKHHDQLDSEATSLFIDYALNRDDQNEFERNKRKRTPTPPRIEPYSPAAFATITDKIKSDTEFAEAAPTLAGWLERGECNKKNANAFYSLIQASNNQIRRLYTEKMSVDEEYQTVKSSLKEKFASILQQFEHVGKILTAAKIQRVSDHFSKQQRRNIEMWLKMTEDVDNIKEEFNTMFDEEDDDKANKGAALHKKYEDLKTENENLQHELEGYKNEAHLAKDEAERKFEKFKAHFIAVQALQNKQPSQHHQVYPPLPPAPPLPMDPPHSSIKPAPPPSPSVLPSEAKLISVMTAFLLVHPLGASLDYLVSYVRSIIPTATQATVHNILQKYSDVFSRQTSGVGANIEHKWTYVTYDVIKKESF